MERDANGRVGRRDLLRLGAVAAATAATGCSSPRTEPGKPRYGMVIDLHKCFGCHACSIACKAEQDVPLGHFKSWVIQSERGQHPSVTRHFIPVLCNHCDSPPCVDGCPTGATWRREDGIVVQDEATCIGCKYCILACPYGVKYSDQRTGTAQKCDFCVHLLDQGLQPACVATCNARARIFGDLNDPESEVSRLIAKHKAQPLKPYMGTEPRVYYIGLEPDVYEAAMRERNAGTAG